MPGLSYVVIGFFIRDGLLRGGKISQNKQKHHLTSTLKFLSVFFKAGGKVSGAHEPNITSAVRSTRAAEQFEAVTCEQLPSSASLRTTHSTNLKLKEQRREQGSHSRRL